MYKLSCIVFVSMLSIAFAQQERKFPVDPNTGRVIGAREISPEELKKWGDNAKHEIFALCEKHLKDTDVLIALLDGPLVDDGTSWEIGYFYSIRKEN